MQGKAHIAVTANHVTKIASEYPEGLDTEVCVLRALGREHHRPGKTLTEGGVWGRDATGFSRGEEST